MTLLDTLRSAWQGVTANIMRSILTMLGILIGVAAVIVLVAVGNGSAKAVTDSISSLGTNTLTISGGRGSNSTFELNAAMVEALQDDNLAPHVKTVAPTVSTSETAAAGTESTTISQIIGTVPSYLKASNLSVSYGKNFTTADVDANSKVILLGESPAEDLFTTARAALGQQVLISGTKFTVVGIVAENSASNSSSMAIAPLTTVQGALTGYSSGYNSIVVQATSSSKVSAATAEIETVLNEVGHITDTSSLPYNVQNQSSLLKTRASSAKTFTILLGVVAGISLVVGGLGITNIMLVTVTERTREIGVRKALGAPRRTILGQFLVESTMLSLTGGLLGVAVALIVTNFKIMSIEPVVMEASIWLSLGISLVIGVFFGSFPAHRAAGLKPVDALRHE